MFMIDCPVNLYIFSCWPERSISFLRESGHLHKERAAVFFGTEKILHGHQ